MRLRHGELRRLALRIADKTGHVTARKLARASRRSPKQSSEALWRYGQSGWLRRVDRGVFTRAKHTEHLRSVADRVADLLKANRKPMRARAMAEAVDVPYASIRTALTALVRSGRIRRLEIGLYSWS